MRKVREQLDILILGPVPPPFGGVAVHVSRLVPLLREDGFRVGVLNHFHSRDADFVLGAMNRNPLNYYRLPKKFPAALVHYHHSRWSTLMAVSLGKRRDGTRYVITIHSGELRDQLNSSVPLLQRGTRWALRRFDAIIVVNDKIEALIHEHVAERPVEVLPAFLGGDDDDVRYETATESFLLAGRTLIVPVFRIRFLKDGREVYGIDSAVRAFLALADERPELRLAIFAAERPSGAKAQDYLARLLRQVKEAGLEDRVLVQFGLPLAPAFRHDVIVLRPTRTEGDALSVREGLHAGLPVIASDAVERPAGTITVATDDVSALCAAVRKVLDGQSDTHVQNPPEADALTSEPFVDRLIGIYMAELRAAAPAWRAGQ
jgi:glycosyltransferase involved in cell wall biosynthesis